MPWWSVVLSRLAHVISNARCMLRLWQHVALLLARLIPFRIASSSVKFICSMSFSDRSQQASSRMDPLSSRVTSISSELASTQKGSTFLSMHQLPHTGMCCITLFIVLFIMYHRVTLCTSSSHPDVTEVMCHFMAAAATLNQPHIGKWPTSFPHKEKVLRRVITGGTSRSSLPCCHRRFSPSPLTLSPSTFAPYSSGSGALQTKPKRSKCSLTLLEEATFSLT